MTDRTIKVSVAAVNKKNVSVKSTQITNEITASADTGKFWAQTSKNWAISENIVDNLDYSSKFYAQKSKEYSEEGKQTLDNLSSVQTEIINNIQIIADDARTEIIETGESEKAKIKDAGDEAYALIATTAATEKAEIENIAQEAIDAKDELVQGNMYKYQLFDTVLKDHILTYEESKGWALQGTYVYKDAVAGSRCGYPDFYAKCLEEYNQATSEQAYLKSNVTSSAVIDNKGVLSKFNNNSSVALPQTFNPGTNPFEIVIKIKTGSDVSTRQQTMGGVDENIAGIEFGIESGHFVWWLSSNGTKYDIASAVQGTYTVLVETTYWVKVAWDGSTYSLSYSLDGTDFAQDMVSSSTLSIFGSRKCLGNDTYSNNVPFFGSIDLNESYININGTRWWSGVTKYEYKTHTNGHKFFDIADKSSIDEVYNSNGIAWYYGIDTTNERIFLPRDKYFAVNGNVLVAGNGKTLGFTDGTNEYGFGTAGTAAQNSGMFAYEKYNTAVGAAFEATSTLPSSKYLGITTNATKSGIEGKLETKEDKYLYICVGNTETESAITDVVDVTTTENDTVPLFTAQYFDFTPNNVSWLKAGEQVNNGGIYTTCYNELVNELTNPKYSLKVIETSAMQSGVDYSEYWKVNQDDMTFTTPTAISNKALSGRVKGNGMTLGLTAGTINYSLSCVDKATTSGANLYTTGYGLSVGSLTEGGSIDTSGTSYAIGVTTDSTKSGIIAEQSTAQLYFKVANAVENLELLDVGEVMEAVNSIISNNSTLIASYAMPSNRYVNLALGTSGSQYTAPADGWYYYEGGSSSGNKYAQLKGVSCIVAGITISGISNVALILPVKKGDVIVHQYNTNMAHTFRFIYAEGSKGEA